MNILVLQEAEELCVSTCRTNLSQKKTLTILPGNTDSLLLCSVMETWTWKRFKSTFVYQCAFCMQLCVYSHHFLPIPDNVWGCPSVKVSLPEGFLHREADVHFDYKAGKRRRGAGTGNAGLCLSHTHLPSLSLLSPTDGDDRATGRLTAWAAHSITQLSDEKLSCSPERAEDGGMQGGEKGSGLHLGIGRGDVSQGDDKWEHRKELK